MDSRYFVYKMTTDNGGAPCLADGLLTLAICMPFLRSSAEVCDWIYGFGGVPLGGRLIYIAQVNDKLVDGAYYRNEVYFNRADCIYQYENGRYVRRKNAKYHVETPNLEKDLGKHHKKYPRAKVLLSRNFRYLGDTGGKISNYDYPDLTKLLDSLRRGHRVNHEQGVFAELEKLRDEIWFTHDEKIVGMPTDKDFSKRCSGGCGPVKVCLDCENEGC